MEDAFDLERFVAAQDRGSSYEDAVRELKRGRKSSHWMWFVFPQLTGLGRSAMAQMYGVDGLDEAKAFLAHPLLGPRLREVTRILAELPSTDAVEVLGAVDAMKLRSSMTLFQLAAPDEPLFGSVLERYFDGEPDPETLLRVMGEAGVR